MVKRYYWNDKFTDKSFDKFIKFQNDLAPDTRLEVWLNSDGGLCYIGEMIRELFESYDPELFMLVASGRICSSAFDLFVAAKCQKHIIPGTIGMVHGSSQWVEINESKAIKLKFTEEKLLEIKFPMIELVQSKLPNVLTLEELNKYYENEDIYLTTEQIKKFLT